MSRANGATLFDFGEWRSEVASKKNPDGTISFVTTAPGISGFEFVVGAGAEEDARHARRAARVRVRGAVEGERGEARDTIIASDISSDGPLVLNL